MWVFTTKGFYSAISYAESKWPKKNLPKRLRFLPSKSILCVRARVRGDLVTLLKDLNKNYRIIKVPGDYPYRVFITKREWEKFLVKNVEDMDYSNFKSAVEDHSRSGALMSVWSAMQRIEEKTGSSWASEGYGYQPHREWKSTSSGVVSHQPKLTDLMDEGDDRLKLRMAPCGIHSDIWTNRTDNKVCDHSEHSREEVVVVDTTDEREEEAQKEFVARLAKDMELDPDEDASFIEWLKDNTVGLDVETMMKNDEGVKAVDFDER